MQFGELVNVEAMTNTDGGKYEWRCTRVEVANLAGHPSGALISGRQVQRRL